MRWHPLGVVLGSALSVFGPRTIMAPLARGLELVLRGSFLRAGYELFFTPVPPQEKRAVKTFIDVGCDRMGDAFGATILYLLLKLGPQQSVAPILLVALLFAAISMWITGRMDAAYIDVLRHGLISRAVAVNEGDVQDSATLSAILRTAHVARAWPPLRCLRRPKYHLCLWPRRLSPHKMQCWRVWPICVPACRAEWSPRCRRPCHSMPCWCLRQFVSWRGMRPSTGRALFC